MPLAVYVLGLSVFSLGTSEFMVAGLLKMISEDLGVSIAEAGLLVSAFAGGMLVGAPLVAVTTLRISRKLIMIAMLVIFAASHFVGAVAPTYEVLFATRVLSALGCAGFWAVAAASAIMLVPPHRRGRAMAVIVGGLTTANVLGVPAGTFVGGHGGWRLAFLCVGLLSVLALVGVIVLVPPESGTSNMTVRLRTELDAYRNPRLWLAVAIIVLTAATTIATFSYLSPILTEVSGLPDGWLPGVLSLFGLGSLAGVLIGGKLADTRPIFTLASALSAMILVCVLLATKATDLAISVLLVFLMGFLGFVTNPALNTRVFALADRAPTLAGATCITAFNCGIALAPWVSGKVIDAWGPYTSAAWVSVAFGSVALLAVVAAAIDEHQDGHPRAHSTARS
ncbi:MFS transporter [Prauserella sp. PE36]|uniref:Cmx/CmrA family chloramphenicol efflux MFS transporter n=1 Tax=Prauserella sp. PE36 TaxID=1504709 RepID=UPI000DE4D794|nr:Cmx/CmrA family chloramphenicol efflux MFS transporter [Prauserella sp. PE36]RBM16964.1 MFS transporter [Prauserella sp. PE36]